MAVSDERATLSDKLAELSARAKEAEGRAVAARDKSKVALHADPETARADAQAQSKKVREYAETTKSKLSVWWYDLQRTWTSTLRGFATTSTPSGLARHLRLVASNRDGRTTGADVAFSTSGP